MLTPNSAFLRFSVVAIEFLQCVEHRRGSEEHRENVKLTCTDPESPKQSILKCVGGAHSRHSVEVGQGHGEAGLVDLVQPV